MEKVKVVKAIRDSATEAVGVYVEEGKVGQEAEFFRKCTGYVTVV
jgi:hypothetical protein